MLGLRVRRLLYPHPGPDYAATPANVGAAGNTSVMIDTTGPMTGTRSGATVTIRIKTLAGRTVGVHTATQATNAALQSRFRCGMPKETYRVFVYAREPAGNAQTEVGSNVLVVW